MNILLLTALYPAPKEFGLNSDTKVVHYYAKEWVKQGHNVNVINLHLIPIKLLMKNIHRIIPGKITKYDIEGIRVGLIDVQLLVPHANRCLRFQTNIITELINKYINDELVEKQDVLFVHYPLSFFGVHMSEMCSYRAAVFHNCDIEQLEQIGETKGRMLLSTYNTIGARNSSVANYLQKKYGINSQTIYSGIPESIICSEEFIEKKANRSIECLNILFAGNLIPLKNVDIAIEAICNLHFNYKFTIVGDGPEKKNLEYMVQQKDKENNIYFAGRLSRDETISKMKESDVFVMVSSPETFGLVYLESMSQGCIPIACCGEGIDGVIKNGENGFLVEPRSVESLKNTLDYIQGIDKSERGKMIMSAFMTARDMTDYNMAKQYIDNIGMKEAEYGIEN